MNRTTQMTTAQTIKRKVQRWLRAVLRNVYTLTFSQRSVKIVKIGKMVLSRINNIGGTRALLLHVSSCVCGCARDFPLFVSPREHVCDRAVCNAFPFAHSANVVCVIRAPCDGVRRWKFTCVKEWKGSDIGATEIAISRLCWPERKEKALCERKIYGGTTAVWWKVME